MVQPKRDDWFRRKTWTEEDRAAFFARLMRSRTAFHKAQYLRIQAFTLAQAGQPDAALALLDRLVAEYPEPSQLALACEHRGTILRNLGNSQAAIEAFAAGERSERAYPTAHTRSALLLALLIVEERMVDRYAEARAAVDHYVSRNPELPFPVDVYHVNLIRAALAKQERRDAQAKEHAASALAASELQSSAFRGHPNLGLVGSATSKLHSWLRRWSA